VASNLDGIHEALVLVVALNGRVVNVGDGAKETNLVALVLVNDSLLLAVVQL
jgi:hypothetical protein